MQQYNQIAVENICNICLGLEFIPGVGGRIVRGLNPRCASCGSMERHRVVHMFYLKIPINVRRSLKTIQFSKDKSVDKRWFKEFEISDYGGNNSIDLMNIKRPSNHYDLVVCNHVLEHIKDDRIALSELFRITKNSGIVQLTVPDPLYIKKTSDWGFADQKQYGHYRKYGQDILDRLKSPLADMCVLSTIGIDLPTGRKEIVYWISRSKTTINQLNEYLRGPVHNLEKEMIYNSISWRITKPIRAIRRLFL